MSIVATELIVGKKAPSFSLENQDGEIVSLSKLKTEYCIIFFYPKDSTPGCTLEAKAFTALIKKFHNIGAEVIGISGGDRKSKQKFCQKAKLDVVLLSDTDNTVGHKYAAFGKKKFMGKSYDGYFRKTFLIGPGKKILKIYENVKPQGHAEEVLADLKEFMS